jgi:hypothetical protein
VYEKKKTVLWNTVSKF